MKSNYLLQLHLSFKPNESSEGEDLINIQEFKKGRRGREKTSSKQSIQIT